MAVTATGSNARWRIFLPLALLCTALAVTGWWAMEALVISQTVRESRTVADMAENVGRWASQYGGVHARTVGADAKFPGNFLTRSTFASTEGDGAAIQGTRAAESGSEQDAMKRVETYYWKNPALIQREVADVITASGSQSRYRMTARSVLNKNNAPNAFEVQALESLQASGDKSEYWVVRGGQVLYARAVIAQKSCLRCHTSAETAPEFIRTNAMFNGGGGYGYVEGKPVGLISVTVPLQPTSQALFSSLSLRIWSSLAVVAVALVWLLVAVWQRPRSSGAKPV